MKKIVLVAVLLLHGCGGADDREPPAAQPFDEMTETIDRAEAVEQQLQEQKDRMDRALEEAEKPPQSR